VLIVYYQHYIDYLEIQMKNYKLYELTEHVCRAINEGYNKSRTIYDYIEYSGTYSSFRSALCKIKKSGYIKFDDNLNSLPKSPFQRKRTYALTAKGQRFLANPAEKLQRKQERLHDQLMNLLEMQPEILQQLKEQRSTMTPHQVIKYINTSMGTNYSDIRQVDQLLEGIQEFKSEMVNENPTELEELRRKYNALVLENQQLRSISINKPVPKKATTPIIINQPINPAKSKLSQLRRQLTQEYFSKKYLDMQFFRSWQNILPSRIKGTKMFTKNSVEFISIGNKEFRRGHAKEMNPEQIASSCFYILKIEDDGIIVAGKGVAENGEKLRF